MSHVLTGLDHHGSQEPGGDAGGLLAFGPGQSWAGIEHIVVDGASTDGTLGVLEAAALAWPSHSASPIAASTTR